MSEEIVYYNNGTVYKKQTKAEIKQKYTFQDDYFLSKEGKKYTPSAKLLSALMPLSPVPKSSYYLIEQLPFVLGYEKNVMAVGYSNKENVYEVYFATYDQQDLEDILIWCKQLSPINEKQKEDIYGDLEHYCFGSPLKDKPFILVSVKLTNIGAPYMCKLYTYPKTYKGWSLWMSGTSYINGKVLEQGQVMSRVFWKMYDKVKQSPSFINKVGTVMGLYKGLEVIVSVIQDKLVVYRYTLGTLMNWKADIYDKELNLVDTKHFYPSNFLKRFMSNDSNRDQDYTFLGSPPAIDYWLGEARYDKSDIKEYFFAVTRGSHQIEQVANYYGIPVPYDASLKQLIDTRPEELRVKYLDLMLAGEGRAIPVIACSLLVKNGKPFSMVLYSFNRPFETDKDCECIKDYSIIDTIISKDLVNDTN